MKEYVEDLIKKSFPGWKIRQSYVIPETCKAFEVVIENNKGHSKVVTVNPEEDKISTDSMFNIKEKWG